ncbi:MAG TPA: ABC transporter permease [Candidatus Merdicola faecigallinarum]|uniref:ABC transporter permease n=1 Tax=Candidatus Merdicola faecigallinarum TaxID=2840862 RepID=A0A9D1M0Q2_9FIRM|nr:ABC transporter permease [Candidatus Merdicola faecigallinarum]
MLFKLSVKNMKKSFKDYAIYFLTLVLGVAIFYMFNSLDSQQAMLQVSESTRKLIALMIDMLGVVSVFIAIILGFLIVYANNFLVNRRKKEFGIYMTLGMGKRQISKIILLETLLIGILSLLVGIFIGVFASQFMSILVAKLFEADMSEFTFVFSSGACIKTCIYFAVMFLAVMIFNTITISKYKLINLLTAVRKNEKVKMKNPILSVFVFLASVGILGYAYWKVTGGINELDTIEKILGPILMGTIGTIGIFWSLSGFILRVIQSSKKIYLRGTNMFVLRQLNNKINTTVVSMSVICIMLFMTISILSSSISVQNSMDTELEEMTPVDLNLFKTANLPDSYVSSYSGKTIYYTEEQKVDSRKSIVDTLKQNGYDISKLKDIVEIPIYTVPEWTWKYSLGNYYETAKAQYSMLAYDTPETLIKVSDYNKIASLYGQEQYTLNDNEYIVLCDFDSMVELRNAALKENSDIQVNGKIYHAKYNECQSGFINMSSSHTNTGVILLPDSFEWKEEWKEQKFLAANYNADTEEGKQEINKEFADDDSKLNENLSAKGIRLDGMTKITLIEASKGLSSIIIFIAIYLGIIFLIASSAILALKQLTESSDNKQRYNILRKIGCDEKMINQALFRQIAIFFMLPLVLAIIHSIFGIKFALTVLVVLAKPEELLPSIIVTAVVMGIIYGLYFLATYLGSKNIIKEEE